MSIRTILYAYIIGGFTFVPLLFIAFVSFAVYTSVPSVEQDFGSSKSLDLPDEDEEPSDPPASQLSAQEVDDAVKPRKGWLTVRRTFEESTFDGGYVTLVRTFLDARSKDPKRSRPKDMWYVVLKGQHLYLYEDEGMTECEAVIQMGSHLVEIYPDGLLDGELFTRRNAICLIAKPDAKDILPSVTKEMKMQGMDIDDVVDSSPLNAKQKEAARDYLVQAEKQHEEASSEAFNRDTRWFIFVRSTVEMEDWYFALLHASDHAPNTPCLSPLEPVFRPSDMRKLVSTLDLEPDTIPMRWLNALIGRVFYSFYRTEILKSFIIGRLMKKLSKVKTPAFLTDIAVRDVSVGNTTPIFSKPMLKELTKEGDAALEVQLKYKGEIRITVQATAIINLGARFKSYTVQLILAVVLRELEGNLLVKVKRPPSNRIWYAFTQTPRMVLEVEPVVSDRQLTWGMILTTIESRLIEVIQESVVMPNMDDIAFFESAQFMRRGGIFADAACMHDIFGRGPTETVYEASMNGDAVAPEMMTKSQSAQEIRDPTPEVDVDSISSTPQLGATDTQSHSAPSNENVAGHNLLLEDVVSTPPPSVRIETTEPSEVNTDPEGDESDASASEYAASAPGRSSSRNSSVARHAASRSLDASSEPSSSKAKLSVFGTSGSSFLSTLKSKAADKEALSNSAKEAIRKWSVNWGGLKKEGGGEDLPDHGPARSESTLSGKARASYAEVRAAVAERKERERTAQEEPTDNKVRSASGSRSFSGLPAEGNPPSAPTSPRAHADSFVDDGPKPVAPIHMQPQAKTMSIPGIHASHRGEVMSIGYVAPSLEPPMPVKNPVYRLWKGGPESLRAQGSGGEVEGLGQTNSKPPPLPPRRPTTEMGSTEREEQS